MKQNLQFRILGTAIVFFTCGIAYAKEGLEITKIGSPTTNRVMVDGDRKTLPGKAIEVRVKNHDSEWSGRIRLTMLIYDEDKELIHRTDFFYVDPDDTEYYDSSGRSIKGKKEVSFWHRFSEGFFDRYDPEYYEVDLRCDGERVDRETNPSSFLDYLEENGIDLVEDSPGRVKAGRGKP